MNAGSNTEADLFPHRSREDPSPAGHSEDTFSFLDRVDSVVFARIRDLLNEWFSRLPPEMQADIGARWRSRDKRQALAAFWEMYVFEAHRRAGFRVARHPEVPGEGKRPDFLIEDETTGEGFYLEATMASRWSDPEAAEESRRRAIYDQIDKRLDSPNFFLEIRFEQEGKELPSEAELVRPVRKWLSELDPDDIGERLRRSSGLEEAPTHTLDARGWRIRFRALPKRAEARGVRGDLWGPSRAESQPSMTARTFSPRSPGRRLVMGSSTSHMWWPCWSTGPLLRKKMLWKPSLAPSASSSSRLQAIGR